MGSLGKITSLKDLPADKKMLGYYRHAAGLIVSGQRTKSLERPAKAAKPAPKIPAELTAALKKEQSGGEGVCWLLCLLPARVCGLDR